MKKLILGVSMLMLAMPVNAAEKEEVKATKAPLLTPPSSMMKPAAATSAPVAAAKAAVVPVTPSAPAANVSEAQSKFQAIKTQEQWIAKLSKQLEGEKNQLNEMRTGLSQAFNLDIKKLEAGKYNWDAKAGKIVEAK